MNNYWWFLLGGALLLRRSGESIGKIVDTRAEGVTPCLDGKFSTHVPRPGVCSYHAGWKGTVAKKPDTVLIQELDRRIVGITEDDITAHRKYLAKLYADITQNRSPEVLRNIEPIWRRFVTKYTNDKNDAIKARFNTIGRKKATTEKGKRARRILNDAIRSFEGTEQVLLKIMSYKVGVPHEDVKYRAMLKARTEASKKRKGKAYWGNTPDDFTPRVLTP